MNYAEYEPGSAPPWLQGKWGRAWFRVSGLLKDACVDRAKLAIKARFADLAPADALPSLLRDYALDQPFNEADATTRARIARAWDTWRLAGTKRGLLTALIASGFANVAVFENFQWTEANPERWWRFWVVLRPPYPWVGDPLADGLWNSPGKWSDVGAWATGIPQIDWARLRGIIRKWKPAHAQCGSAILLLTGELFGTRKGTWGEQTAWSGAAVYLDI